MDAQGEEGGVNWDGRRILDDLADAGWSIYRVAQHLGRKWDTVNRWRDTEPRYSDAKALLDLHGRICPTTPSVDVSRETYP